MHTVLSVIFAVATIGNSLQDEELLVQDEAHRPDIRTYTYQEQGSAAEEQNLDALKKEIHRLQDQIASLKDQTKLNELNTVLRGILSNLERRRKDPNVSQSLMERYCGLEEYLQMVLQNLDHELCNMDQRVAYAANQVGQMEQYLASIDQRISNLEHSLQGTNGACCPPPCAFLPGWVNTGCRGWYGDVAFLYWTVREGELGYVVDNGPLVSPGVTGAIGDIESAVYEWNPGVSVSLGFGACDCWEIFGQYTYFTTSGSDSVTRESGESIHGLFGQFVGPAGSTDVLLSANSDIKLYYNTFDLLAARSFLLSNRFKAQVLAGATGAYIKQDWDIEYVGATQSQDIESNWKFGGAGLKFGGIIDWLWGCGLGVTGKFCGGILYGAYHNQLENIVFGAANGVVEDVTLDDPRFVETLQFAVGPFYHTCFRGYHIDFYATYEMNTWFNLQEILRSEFNFSTADSGGRDSRHTHGFFGLHGIRLGLHVAF